MPVLFEGVPYEQFEQWEEIVDAAAMARLRSLDQSDRPWEIIGLDTANVIVKAHQNEMREYLPPVPPGMVLNATLGVRLWAAFRNEVRILVCTDDPRYADVRSQFAKEGNNGGHPNEVAEWARLQGAIRSRQTIPASAGGALLR